ncbi:hypothetical protein ACWEPM_36285 [Streptomyces sp. NPDC004244]
MELRFVGMDPNTGGEGPPTVWVEEESSDLVEQGEATDELFIALVGSTEWVAGHRKGIPPYERVIRIPARMVPILREACDAAERAS